MRVRDLQVRQREKEEEEERDRILNQDDEMEDTIPKKPRKKKSRKKSQEKVTEGLTLEQEWRGCGLDDNANGQLDTRDQGTPRLRTPSPPSPRPGQSSIEGNKYDETLLAVIGVLDAIKGEDNVAGWIRAGSLWGIAGRECGEELPRADGETLGKTNGQRAEVNKGGPVVGQMAQARDGTEFATGNDANQSGDCVTRHLTSTPPPSTSPSQCTPLMWYERPDTMEYWVSRGKGALCALGIEIDPGI